jgi:hypothetical protein
MDLDLGLALDRDLGDRRRQNPGGTGGLRIA